MNPTTPTTNATKHTPGPWHTGTGNGEGSVFSNEGRTRLETGGTTLYPICKVIDFAGEAEANARLIASAPALLEALRELLAIGEGGIIERRETGKPTWYALDAIKETARAAIAQAEGSN